MVAKRIDELEGNNRNSHFGHDYRELVHAATGRAETEPRVNSRAVGMPKQIAVAFQEVVAEVEING